MKWGIRIAGLIVLTALVAFVWWFTHRERPAQELTLYGNVDLREVDLAFNNNERIFRVLVTEGDHVYRGQVLARVDTSRLAPQVAQAEANVALDSVNLANARDQYQRNMTLSRNSGGRGVARQDVDNMKAAFDVQAARRQADAAQLTLLRQELADAVLVSPADATVRTRIMEPGEMASPTRPVFSLAITDPKWVRVYVSETDLGKLHPGMAATISVDAFPGKRFPGWIGFISPSAEFTPKSVETEDLRTSLVYEVRVFVKDPADALRLGMPATVHVKLARFAAEARP
ncbi:MAG TPA: efflux RND transporter periplasmic adaptor subunit [Rhizomicrobium sp.]|nr:efflux RND transporter periplasmic adaptor subunit [Rhizomicrobium sp.]